MKYPHDVPLHRPQPRPSPTGTRSVDVPPRARVLKRPFAIAWLTQRGTPAYDTIYAPAIPVVEAACSSLARGALVTTNNGPVAVEDLEPGMIVETVDQGPLPLKWVGSYDMSAREAQANDRARLFRVTADAFGLGKPAQDLMLAPRAHILLRDAACQTVYGFEKAFAPVRAFEDGANVISIAPMSAVSLFNVAFDRQATIRVNGMEVESYHPGPYAETLIDGEMLYALLQLFPHVRSLAGFGAQTIDRLTAFEVKSLREDA